MSASPTFFARDGVPLVISHGGDTRDRGDGAARSGTWSAYRRAADDGFTAFQVDVVLAGGALFSKHAVFGRARRLEGRSYADARESLGADVPTLGELIEWRPDARWNIELKSNRCVEPLIDVLDGLADRSNIGLSAPFHTRSLRRLRAQFPDVATNASLREGALLGWSLTVPLALPLGWLRRRRSGRAPDGVQLWRPLARPRAIAACRRRGWFVQVWTVDDRETAVRLLRRGVEGFIANDLDELRNLRKPSGNP